MLDAIETTPPCSSSATAVMSPSGPSPQATTEPSDFSAAKAPWVVWIDTTPPARSASVAVTTPGTGSGSPPPEGKEPQGTTDPSDFSAAKANPLA